MRNLSPALSRQLIVRVTEHITQRLVNFDEYCFRRRDCHAGEGKVKKGSEPIFCLLAFGDVANNTEDLVIVTRNHPTLEKQLAAFQIYRVFHDHWFAGTCGERESALELHGELLREYVSYFFTQELRRWCIQFILISGVILKISPVGRVQKHQVRQCHEHRAILGLALPESVLKELALGYVSDYSDQYCPLLGNYS